MTYTLNPPERLPPVCCPLVIELPCGRLVRAERTGHVEQRGREMEYRLDDGRLIVGHFKWSYP